MVLAPTSADSSQEEFECLQRELDAANPQGATDLLGQQQKQFQNERDTHQQYANDLKAKLATAEPKLDVLQQTCQKVETASAQERALRFAAA